MNGLSALSETPPETSPETRPLVAVDVGNSFTHLRAYSPPRGASATPQPCGCSLQLGSSAADDEGHTTYETLAQWIAATLPASEVEWWIASVNRPTQRRLCDWLSKHRARDRWQVLTRNDLDLAVEVEQPDRVGLDRLAAAVAANRLRSPERPAIVIDSGSAITVDLVAADGSFQGGAILPGLQMGARALAENTDQLPEIRISEHPPLPVGKCTVDAIQAGLFWGLLGGIHELVRQISRTLPVPPQLFVTGGGAVWQMLLEQYPEGEACYVPDLVLAGIAATGFARQDARPGQTPPSPDCLAPDCLAPDGLAPDCLARVLTGSGRGAIATIEVAGPAALSVLERHFESVRGKRIAQLSPRQFAFGHWQLAGGSREEVLVLKVEAGRYELHCHGGTAMVEVVCEDLRRAGAEVAEDPWTQLSDSSESPIRSAARPKLALTRTERTAAIVLDQFGGALEKAFQEVQWALQQNHPSEAIAQLNRLLARAEVGMHLVEPFRVVLAGEPNVGKSSLINRLIGFERTIVDPTAGTTRDVITAETAMEGWPITLSDTAGLREALDAIESEGVSRARRAIEQADLVILVADASHSTELPSGRPMAEQALQTLREQLGAKRCLLVCNKIDLAPARDRLQTQGQYHEALPVSALTGEGVAELLQEIPRRLVPQPPQPGDAVPFDPAHINAIRQALQSLPNDPSRAWEILQARRKGDEG